MEHLSESLSKSTIKNLKKHIEYYIIVPWNETYDVIKRLYRNRLIHTYSNEYSWLEGFVLFNSELNKLKDDHDIDIYQVLKSFSSIKDLIQFFETNNNLHDNDSNLDNTKIFNKIN